MIESCHSHYQSRSHTSLPLLEDYIGRQWRLTGAVLRRGWDPQERPFAPEHEQNEINRGEKLTDSQQAEDGKERSSLDSHFCPGLLDLRTFVAKLLN